MKLITFAFVASIILQSCPEKTVKKTELIGSWKLVEILADPGDGSGTFQSIEGNKTIQFLDNQTIVSNNKLCTMGIHLGETTGTYSIDSNYIKPNMCLPNHKINFQLVNETLLLKYPCFEDCIEKYVKVK